MTDQSYKTHRRLHPPYHFIAAPILGINLIWTLVRAFRFPTVENGWQVLVAAALGIVCWVARSYPLRVQDRLITLEERLRLARQLPGELGNRVSELRPGQLVGLRFCSDEELAEVVREVLDKKLTRREDIKRRIKTWRPDTFRV